MYLRTIQSSSQNSQKKRREKRQQLFLFLMNKLGPRSTYWVSECWHQSSGSHHLETNDL